MFNFNFVANNLLVQNTALKLVKKVHFLRPFSSIAITKDPLRPFNDIPGPKPLPLIGNLWRYLPGVGTYKLSQFDENGKYNLAKYGSLVREFMFGDHVILHVFDPKDMESVFRQEGKYPNRRSHRALLKYRRERPFQYNSGGIIPENGEEWLRMRKLFHQPLLNPINVNRYMRDFEQVSQSLVDYVRHTRDDKLEMIDFQEDLYKWALENVAVFALDTRLGCLDVNLYNDGESDALKLIKTTHDTLEAIANTEMGSDSWKKRETKDYRQLVDAQDVMSSIIDKYLQDKMKSLGDENDNENKSLLAQFLKNTHADYKDIFTMISDLFLAGIDTTSYTGGFALYYLAQNQTAQDKLRSEIKQSLPCKQASLTPDILSRMSYLKACVKETFRMSPVSIGTGRLTTQDMVVRNFKIPSGVQIITQNQVACRQEEHFKNANSFQPERWLDSTRASPFVLLPFGYGPRSCVGRRFSELELYVLLSKIIANFRVEYHYEDIGVTTKIINFPDKPMRFRFIDL